MTRTRQSVRRDGSRSRGRRVVRYLVAPWEDSFFRGAHLRDVWVWDAESHTSGWFTFQPDAISRDVLSAMTESERLAWWRSRFPEFTNDLFRMGVGHGIASGVKKTRHDMYRLTYPDNCRDRRRLARWFGSLGLLGYELAVRKNIRDCQLYAGNALHIAIACDVDIPPWVRRHLALWAGNDPYA